MSAWRKVFTAQIRATPQTLFALIADMPNYGRWLPGSQAFGATTQVTPYPVRLGTTYLDAGPAGRRPGSVTEFEPPRRITFHHTMALKVGPLTGDTDIHVRYALHPAGQETRVVRDLDMTIEVSALIKPLVLLAFRRENVRILAALKRYAERLTKQA
jgi:uncharacterized protein YndB with AHSA1/START domain